jgi:hypothetical protein
LNLDLQSDTRLSEGVVFPRMIKAEDIHITEDDEDEI